MWTCIKININEFWNLWNCFFFYFAELIRDKMNIFLFHLLSQLKHGSPLYKWFSSHPLSITFWCQYFLLKCLINLHTYIMYTICQLICQTFSSIGLRVYVSKRFDVVHEPNKYLLLPSSHFHLIYINLRFVKNWSLSLNDIEAM